MKKTGRAAVAVVLSAAFLAVSGAAGSGRVVAAGGLVLENVARPSYVLDNDAGGGADSSVLVFQRNGGPNQSWQVAPENGNPVQIRQQVGGRELCMAAVFNGMADVSMQGCSGGVAAWHEIKVGDNRFAYRNNAQGTCIAMTRENTPAELVECDFGDQEQQWIKRAG